MRKAGPNVWAQFDAILESLRRSIDELVVANKALGAAIKKMQEAKPRTDAILARIHELNASFKATAGKKQGEV